MVSLKKLLLISQSASCAHSLALLLGVAAVESAGGSTVGNGFVRPVRVVVGIARYFVLLLFLGSSLKRQGRAQHRGGRVRAALASVKRFFADFGFCKIGLKDLLSRKASEEHGIQNRAFGRSIHMLAELFQRLNTRVGNPCIAEVLRAAAPQSEVRSLRIQGQIR